MLKDPLLEGNDTSLSKEQFWRFILVIDISELV